MIPRLLTGLACVRTEWRSGGVGTAAPPGTELDQSALLRAVGEQLLHNSDPPSLPGFLLQDLLAGGETAVLVGSVDSGSLLDFPAWTAQVFIYAGLCLLLLGLMAWLGSYRLQRRAWGRRLALSGGGLFVVGSAWTTFIDLLTYVLG